MRTHQIRSAHRKANLKGLNRIFFISISNMEPLIPEKPIWVLPRHPKSCFFGQTKNTHQNRMWSDQLQVLYIVVLEATGLASQFLMLEAVVLACRFAWD
ncbi:hypothetical protein AKJ16_DCAP06430 [Drosera capensis]